MTTESLTEYAFSRFVRIYPLYLLAVAAYWDFGYMTQQNAELCAVFGASWAHLWTIPVEVSFYFFLPPIVLALGFLRSVSTAAMFAAVAGLFVIQQFAFPYWHTPDNSLNVMWYLPAFVFGSVAAMVREVEAPRWFRDWTVWAILLGVVISTPLALNLMFGIEPSRYLMDKHAYFGAAYALLLFCVVGKSTWWSWLFDSAVLRKIGEISYPTYLFHQLVMYPSMFIFAKHQVFGAFAAIAGSIALGWAVHIAVERPLMSWKKSRDLRLIAQS
jgi:peptidoglycan/LPS O-acetylase OafA/YrhL